MTWSINDDYELSLSLLCLLFPINDYYYYCQKTSAKTGEKETKMIKFFLLSNVLFLWGFFGTHSCMFLSFSSIKKMPGTLNLKCLNNFSEVMEFLPSYDVPSFQFLTYFDQLIFDCISQRFWFIFRCFRRTT